VNETNGASTKTFTMKLTTHIALAVGCGLLSYVALAAQSPQQQKPPAQKPAESNPFPEDTSKVPVVPTTAQPAPPTAASAPENAGAESTTLLRNDNDPVHSPDDPVETNAGADGFSSSLAGSGDVNIPDEDRPEKHRRRGRPEPAVKQVTAKENEDVAEFELSRKNYKAALSRFQSALVTDSENPDVYWGIAEAQRGLGNYAEAKANYQKVVDYEDPEAKHSKEAKKLLKTPQLANAPAVSANQAPQQ
jgi:hypothetical protein